MAQEELRDKDTQDVLLAQKMAESKNVGIKRYIIIFLSFRQVVLIEFALDPYTNIKSNCSTVSTCQACSCLYPNRRRTVLLQFRRYRGFEYRTVSTLYLKRCGAVSDSYRVTGRKCSVP